MIYVVFIKVVKGELSPFDEAALETALRLRETVGGRVIAVTMAPDSAADRMRALTRIGVDRAVLLSDAAFAGSDTAATSYVLSLAAKKLTDGGSFLILCGRQSMDGDTAQVGVSIAARLGIPSITNVMRVDSFSETAIACETRMGSESVPLSALITVERIAKLRFASMRARAHEIERYDAAWLGADRRRIGQRGSPTKGLRSFESDKGRRFCKFLSADALAAKLCELADAPRAAHTAPEASENKLPTVYAVGSDVAAIASGIAEQVVMLERMTADRYVQLFAEKKPDVVLFPADLWGRRIAPEVATRLETGLCADCTQLETDGEHFYMYRPALGGSVTAKIECRTKPQMATVRTVEASSDIIFSCGLGVRNCLETARALADRLGAGMGASRGLVDAGLAPYEWQVGITGRTVSPKIYIAAGISGAVHHTAAIGTSDYIVGINPDKNAQIFDFCDFGFVGTLEDFSNAFIPV